MKTAGIIGCGAIGASLAAFITREFSSKVRLRYVCDHSPEKVAKLRSKLKGVSVSELSELLRRCDLVIEAASPHAVTEILKHDLRSEQEILIMSVGGLLRLEDPLRFMDTKKARFFIPSGAVAGLDGIAAAAESGIKSVAIKTRKPPRGLMGAPYFENKKFPVLKGSQEVRVFRGCALDAVKSFPQNINVAAVLSLAGLGPKKTMVEIWTSNSYKKNRHEVYVESGAGKMMFVTENMPSRGNPRTSALAIDSAKACLRRILGAERVGT